MRAVDAAAVADYLGHSPVFAPLTHPERLELASRMRPRRYERNEVIFHRHDAAGHVHLIATGTVKISVPGEAGHEVVVGLARGGDVFGEVALFDDGPRSATVTALTETTTFMLANRDFMNVLRCNPEAMSKLLALLAQRIRQSTGHVEDLVFLDLHGRVAKFLLDQSDLFGGEGPLELTQDDLAGFVGATRVATNRCLVDLERRGGLRLGRGQVTILDRELLRSAIRY